MTVTTQPPTILTGQLLHLVSVAMLLFLVWLAWVFMGHPPTTVFWIAVAIPVIHQVFVWLAWRLEFRSEATSKTIGFQGYVLAFFLLFGSRFVSLFVLAWMDRGSLGLPLLLQAILTVAFTLPGLYAMYSVSRYFGLIRAAGADHFDPAYRDMPLVNKGIFQYTSNGMYVYAFLLFWAIAIGFNSLAALTIAAFSHAYIWVHYYATEKPDMDYLYAESSRGRTTESR